jgi:hypothetical protein
MSVSGIGPIISSAMVAAINTGDVFSKGRDFAAWLRLVPKRISNPWQHIKAHVVLIPHCSRFVIIHMPTDELIAGPCRSHL